jgi:hypothetical protein
MPHGGVRQARLAKIAYDHGRTRHACRQTKGADKQPTPVTFQAAQNHKMVIARARFEICSGIVVIPNSASKKI